MRLLVVGLRRQLFAGLEWWDHSLITGGGGLMLSVCAHTPCSCAQPCVCHTKLLALVVMSDYSVQKYEFDSYSIRI